MITHEVKPAIMEPGPHIKHSDGDTERWVTVDAERGEDLWCPYCGEKIGYE